MSVKPFPVSGLGHGFFLAHGRRNAKTCFPVAVFPDMQGERARIHAIDAGHAVFFQVLVQTLFAAPVAGTGEIADYESGKKESAALGVRRIDSVVAYLGGGERYELPRI